MDGHLFLSQSTVGCDTDVAEQSDSHLEPVYEELEFAQFYCNDSRHDRLIQLTRKAVMDYEELYNAFQDLQKKLSKAQKLLSEKDKQIRQLKTASEAVYNEYGKLQTKYAAEQEAMNDVMQQASQWYSQNQQLKRKSHLIVQRMAELKMEDVKIDEDDEEEEKNKEELSELLRTIEVLKREIGELTVKLHATELKELETREKADAFKQQYEHERKKHETKKEELSIVKKTIEQFENVSYLAVQEIADLHKQYKAEKRRSAMVHMEVEQMKVEKKAMAHQSALLMNQAAPSEKLMNALLEIEKLTKNLEEERLAHKQEAEALKNELNRVQSNEMVDVLETQIKCLNSEIDILRNECKQHERKTKELEQKIKHIEKQNLLLETSAAPPPPPPPPPPPLPQASFLNPLNALMTMIGISKTTKALPACKQEDPRKAAMDQMLDKIKNGQFTLRRTRERTSDSDNDAPEALVEMQKLLKSLKSKTNDSGVIKREESPDDAELFAVFRKKSIGLMSPEDKELIRQTLSADLNQPDSVKASRRVEVNGTETEKTNPKEKTSGAKSPSHGRNINSNLVRFYRKQSLDSALSQDNPNELQAAFQRWGVKSEQTT